MQANDNHQSSALAIAPATGGLPLPTDFPPTATTVYQAERHSFSLVNHLPELDVATNINVRSLLLAAFQVLLYRYTQQETIDLSLGLIETETIERQFPTLTTMIQPEQTVRAFVDQLTQQLENPLSRSDDSTLPPSLPAIAFTWITGTVNLGEVDAANSPANPPDLHLQICQQPQGLASSFIYNANRFQPATIQRLAGHFQVVLTGCISQPDCPIAQLPLLTPAEQQQLLKEWQSATVTYDPVPIHHAIETHAAHTPTAIALRFNQQQLTYAELNQRANQLAHYLIDLSVGPGVSVAVCMQPSLEAVIGLLAILKSGGCYVPLDPTHPPERLATILEDTQAKVLLTQTQLLPNLPATTEHRLCLDHQWYSVQSLPDHNPNPDICLDQTAYIIYTSGTTGKPKGVMASHRNLINYIRATQERFGFNQQDVMPAIARFTFSIALFEVLSPLVAGGTLVLFEREQILDFKYMAQALAQLTMLHTVPSLMQKLLTYIRENGIDPQTYQGMKHVFTGGDMVPPDLLETMQAVFPNANVSVLYGCSEVSSLCCSYPVLRNQAITKSRIGKPFNNVLTRLYDAHQNLVPIGVPGEIYVGGKGVTKGYLNRDDLTEAKFVMLDGERFYRTGDRGRMDGDGNIEFLGRTDFQVKLRGIRIELNEIETILRQIPGVREGVVVARELQTSEKSLVAYVVLDPSYAVTTEQIRQTLQSKLPDYMVPAAIVTLSAMPLNPNQKIDRRALPTPSLADLAGGNFTAPRTPGEQQLTEIWETLLGIQSISVHHNFFELGGNSLMAAQMFSRIEQRFGKQLPLSKLLVAPTIAQLAPLLEQSIANQLRESLVLLRAGGSKPPLFLIHDGDGETLLYHHLANCFDPAVPVYGIEPYGNDRCPILHTRIPAMIDYYIAQIRRIQPQGPYFLGGLCMGGILAFETACQLQRQGQRVTMVALFDAAAIAATPRSGVVTSERLDRFSQVFHNDSDRSRLKQALHTLKQISRKVINLVTYEVQRRYEGVCDRVRFPLLRYHLDRGLTLPAFLEGIPARKVLQWSQQDYVPDTIFDGSVLLFRSTQKSATFAGTAIDDTPFAERYSDPLMGWGKRVSQSVEVHDIPGGHSSMLQAPNVQVLAAKIQAYMDAALQANNAMR